MISKNHRQNHNFQIVYFLIGSCHTPDAAYALLQDLREDRAAAIDTYRVSQIKQKAEILKANKLISSIDEIEQLEGEAKLLEIENHKKTGIVLYQAAVDELNFIDECISKLQPQRKYKLLSDSEACQAMQQEEWKLELIKRAENYLLTTGTIPSDHFDTMRMHPDFKEYIFPAITEIRKNIQSNEGVSNILEPPKNLLDM